MNWSRNSNRAVYFKLEYIRKCWLNIISRIQYGEIKYIRYAC